MIIKPAPTSAPAIISVILGPMRLQIKLPKNAPRQKKHIVKVKLRAYDESLQPNSSLNGIFNIDQAYRIPENNIEKTQTTR